MLSLSLSLLFLVGCANGLNFVSNALGSNMVLQRGPLQANLWGWSKTPGSEVTVKFNDQLYKDTAKTDGAWMVKLPQTQAGGPYTIEITSTAGESATLHNVLFGDVWICGGQSNMEFTVDQVFNASEEVKKAANYPNIRLFTVGQGTVSSSPLEEFGTIFQPWTVASPASVGLGNWTAFSAVCWLFGRDLYDRYKVPIGLFSDNWGGTIIQTWSSPEALQKCGSSAPLHKEVPKVGAPDPNHPSLLWNAMIVPVLRMSILGTIWYQGENNAYDPNYYACGFPEMIRDWRARWGSTFGFYYVQLAPWLATNNSQEALTRLAQLFANSLPKVGVATAMDLGDPSSPFGSIHPRDKQTVGARLSAVARALTYNEHVAYLGPMANEFRVISATGNAVVEVSFTPASVVSGLVFRATTCDKGVPENQCAGFELTTTTGTVVTASASQSGSTIRVAANVGTATVAGVRYGFANYPLATLWNKDGFPALPFAFPNPVKPTTTV